MITVRTKRLPTGFRTFFMTMELLSLLVMPLLWLFGFLWWVGLSLSTADRLLSAVGAISVVAMFWWVRFRSSNHRFKLVGKVVLLLAVLYANMNLLASVGGAIHLSLSQPVLSPFWFSLTILSVFFVNALLKSHGLVPLHYLLFPAFNPDRARIGFLIPAFNEERTIGRLVRELRSHYPRATVLVVDNNSTDRTTSEARSAGAEVIFEGQQGKGNAVRTGFIAMLGRNFDAVVMMDADLTYPPSEARKLIQAASKGGYGVALGNRLNNHRQDGAITTLNFLGNVVLTFSANFLYGTTHSDVCTGYWLFRPKAIEILLAAGMRSPGFGVEAEMLGLLANSSLVTVHVPITYGVRPSGASHLHPFRDGYSILKVLVTTKLTHRHGDLRRFVTGPYIRSPSHHSFPTAQFPDS